MARYQAGDITATRSLIDHVSPNLYRFLAARCGRMDADDLLQEAWLRIHRARHTYRPGEPLLPWIYAIARRVRADHYRRSVRRASREQRLDDAEVVADTADTGSAGQEALEELLAPLSQSQREVIELLKVAGLTLEEVALATASSVGSVKQKVHRAYNKLRRRLSGPPLKNKQSGALP